MNILLLTGKANTGKSEIVHDTVEWLMNNCGYKIKQTFHSPKNLDVEMLLEGKKRILVHSATDDNACIDALLDNLDDLGKSGLSPDILLTTSRLPNSGERMYECRQMGWQPLGPVYGVLNDSCGNPILEIPLCHIGKNQLNSTLPWYKQHINNLIQHILLHPPFEVH